MPCENAENLLPSLHRFDELRGKHAGFFSVLFQAF